jgi:hypothetical protein
MPDDLATTMEILRRNYEELDSSESDEQLRHNMQNFLASVNSLVAHSYRIAGEHEKTEEWEVEQKMRELQELLDGI